MRRPSRRAAGWALALGLLACGAGRGAAGDEPPPPASRPDLAELPAWLSAIGPAESRRRHGLDPTSPLASRVRAATPPTLHLLGQWGSGDAAPGGRPLAPTPHDLTDADRGRFEAALGALLPLHRRVLRDRLRGFAFLDGMPVSGIVTVANPGEPHALYDVTIRADVLRLDASEWLTRKERGCFRGGEGGEVAVSIDVGRALDAITYVLLHEATHVVDLCDDKPAGPPAPGLRELVRRRLEVGPPHVTGLDPHLGRFGEGVWDRWGLVAAYRDPLREQVRYYQPAHALPLDRAPEIYEGLRRTPFASLYSAQNPREDLAEFVTLHHCTAVLGHPYRIVVHRGDAEPLTLEPMKSDLVRGRAGRIRRFYDADPPPAP